MPTQHAPTVGARAVALNIGRLLRAARLRRRRSKTALADQAGICQDTLTRIEQGDGAVSLEDYVKAVLAVGLGSSLAFILDEDAGYTGSDNVA
ncbi:helix-turn-helix domain-containing protein [Nitrospirillum viridazoti]|uniref:helix-turn-helix domain-containing protein n=1 Tax=Nitrospirillum viridazoti TaxID=3144925 RepID=UPI0009D97D31|nr:helix-turn-helix transcriptional regulator [Nitrospirillum amazonense]